jgi:hypothetical protein
LTMRTSLTVAYCSKAEYSCKNNHYYKGCMSC